MKERRNGTRLGRAHMARVAQLECSTTTVALTKGPGATPCGGRTTVHHCLGLAFRGTGMKAKDTETIPLCDAHHQNGPTAIHKIGMKAWERIYGSQQQHLETTRMKLAFIFPEFNEVTGEKL